MPRWCDSPRELAAAVLASLPCWVHAQGLPPLAVDARLIAAPRPTDVAPAAPQPAMAPRAAESVESVAQTAAPAAATQQTDVVAPTVAAADGPETTHLEAGRITGRQDVDLQAFDGVRLTRGDLVLTSDTLTYDQIANEVTAEGNVVLTRRGDRVAGPRARINLDTWFGEFEQPTYALKRQKAFSGEIPARGTVRMLRTVTATGQADQLKLEGENQYRLTNATYSSCPAPDPDWYLRVRDLQLDYDRDQGTGRGSTLVFQDVPIAYMPWAQFPLSGGRQSGLLPPTVGGTSNTGFDLTVPYYFNLAPNYDATFAPRYMSRRGMLFGGETRYLTRSYRGVVRGEWVPDDSQAGKSRAAVALSHNQDFGHGLTAAVAFNQVSDSAYFADLSSRIGSTSQATLNRQLLMNYSSGSWLTGSVNVQHYQTLTGEAPYDRLPEITASAKVPDFHGFSLALPLAYAQFAHDTKDEARRVVAYPQVGFPIQRSAFYITPKVGVHVSHYEVDRRTSSGPTSLNRSVPIFSVDSGLNFERDTSWNDKPQIQTLEPRLYYVRAGYTDQSDFPVFDTARADFNFAQIFSENVYAGQDRIADSNQLTAGVQSRLIEADTGEEWIRAALGQRFYFSDQRVTLPGEQQRTGSVADLLAAFTGRVYRSVWVDSALQFDQRNDQVQRATLGLRYQPDFAKVMSVSYRFKNGEFRDLDITAQWPLWRRWYGVGRYNRNLRDHTLTEAIAGLEYKADCWVFRGVWQTLLNTKQTRNDAFFLQIEFNGLASIGSSPLNLLKRSVSGYGKINDPAFGDPVFGAGADD